VDKPYRFSKRSAAKLHTCSLGLQDLFYEVIKHRDCTVLCGHRTEAEQNVLYPKYTNVVWPYSNHNYNPSKAVDVVPCPVDWEDIEGFHEFAGFVLGTAEQMGIKVKWGGHFKTLFDGPHYEMY